MYNNKHREVSFNMFAEQKIFASTTAHVQNKPSLVKNTYIENTQQCTYFQTNFHYKDAANSVLREPLSAVRGLEIEASISEGSTA